jgi:hypothetical protein
METKMTQPKPTKKATSAAQAVTAAKPEGSAELTGEQLDKVKGGSQSSGAGAGKITVNPS